ncbi:MAG TPA: DNA-binding domain-containing protein [Terracidiphilus sp.]|jgi:hypothetical protein|nr:DNA-binding domain-containing protein [Terracidiphilus sp.]
MSAGPRSLEAIQRAMAAAVMQPLTPDDNMVTTAADGRAMRDVAGSFIAPNKLLTPFDRLEIYNRQYWYRVLGALAEDFPGLRAVVGAPAFHKLSIAYLTEHPNQSFTLRNLGGKLPDWLAAHPQFAGRRHRLAVDVARMEWAFVEAFDSAEWSPLTLEQIATLDAGSRLGLQPHLQLVALEYPADDLVLNLHKGEKRQTTEAGVSHDEEDETPAKLPGLRRRPIWLAAHRVDYSVYYLRLQREEFSTLRALRQGLTLADALETGFIGSKVPQERRPRLIQNWFAQWSELGWICAPDLEILVKA